MNRVENTANASEKRRLAEFLVGNSELEQLSAKLSQFNILQVLRIERAEIRHSNVLGWLLNPRDSHGLSDTFVRRFISTILLDNERATFDLSPAAVELMDLVDVEVWREWRNIDLLVHSKANGLIILIENKIRSKESEGQLLKYSRIVRQSFPDIKVVVPVLLTLEGDEPSETAQGLGYIPWSHAALYEVMMEIIEQQEHRIPQDAQTFLRHYLSTLRKETMQDKELEDLCKAIYRKHKPAIDLIVRYGATTAFGEAAENFIGEHEELEQIKMYDTQIWFVPKEWARVMPKTVENWRSPYPVALWFFLDRQSQRVGVKFEIGPLPNSERRRQLVEAFRHHGFTIPTRVDQEDARYTRFFSRTRVLSEIYDPNEVKQSMEELWQQSRDEVTRASKVIKDFTWEG